MSDYIQSKGHIQLAHDMAVQSMVLLKNDPNNSLPITAPYKKACVSLFDVTIIVKPYSLFYCDSEQSCCINNSEIFPGL